MRECALAGLHEPQSAASSVLERGIVSSCRCKSGFSDVPRRCVAIKFQMEPIFDFRSLTAHIPVNDTHDAPELSYAVDTFTVIVARPFLDASSPTEALQPDGS